jgi:hypothetical protein
MLIATVQVHGATGQHLPKSDVGAATSAFPDSGLTSALSARLPFVHFLAGHPQDVAQGSTPTIAPMNICCLPKSPVTGP